MPSMHDMIDELNDMDCPSYSGSESISNCNYGSNNYGTNNYGFGCGFGSWIWILLILFYAGQGGTANTGCCCGNTASNNVDIITIQIMDHFTVEDIYSY